MPSAPAPLVPGARQPAEPLDRDAQVSLIRTLASEVTHHKMTHEQAVAELRRQLSLQTAPPAGAEA